VDYLEDGGSEFLPDGNTYVQTYMVSYPRRL